MSTNITKQKRDELVSKINQIREFLTQSSDENATQLLRFLGELENDVTNKHYGLVFEEHRESIDEKLESSLPVLTEDKSLEIDNGGLQNFLIEGDNLASLKLLEKTHRGKIDVIYIDPPYNTGSNDFMYDDCFVDENDTFRHSKWISFLSKRLILAKKLLSEKGLIFISINNIEYAALKLYLDEIFSPCNFVSTLIWKCRSSLYYTEPLFSDITEYILVYAKKKDVFWLKAFDKDNIGDEKNIEGFFLNRVKKKYDGDNYSNPDNDPNGPFVTSGKVRNDGRPVYTVTSPTGVKHTAAWIYTPKIFEELDKAGQIYWGKDGSAQPRKKSYLKDFIGNVPSNVVSDEFARILKDDGSVKKEKYFEVGTTESGTKELKEIIGENHFPYPKPSTLIKYLISLYPEKSSTILDFFAGSGTTGHAVMKLNATDNGNRKFILCTNNQNNICRDITYERLKRVIEKENYSASLKYFRVDFVDITDKLYYEYADKLLKHTRELVELENAITFNKNSKIAICLTEEELDSFCNNKKKIVAVEKIYLGHEVQTTAEQEDLFNSKQIEIVRIPNYYYSDVD